MAKQARRNSDESLIVRFNQATEEARRATVRKTNTLDPGYEDIAPLGYWRERWHDPKVQRRFIEKFFLVRNAFLENQIVPVVFNDAQVMLNQQQPEFPVTVKCRRIGSTLYWLMYFFATALINPGCNIRLVPHDPDTEEEFFTVLKTIYENLPEHLRTATRYYSKELIHFHDPEKGVVDSRIKTSTPQPGKENKGRGIAFTHLLLTEVPFWQGDQKKTVLALIEAAAGGQVVVESTAQGMEWFYKTYLKGKNREDGWQSFFFPWWFNRNYRESGAYFLDDGTKLVFEGIASAVEDRERKIAKVIFRHLRKFKHLAPSENWYCDAVAEYVAWRRKKISKIGEAVFLVEYPENDATCFQQSGRPLIAAQFLKVTCRTSEPVDGREYAIGVDVAIGLLNGDASAIQIVDLTTGRQVFEEELRIAPDLLAEKLADYSDQYNCATLVVERNGPGIATINKLLELGYEDRLYKFMDARTKRAVEDGRKDTYEAIENLQFGFPTTTETKPLLGLELERAIRTGELGISSEKFCEQAKACEWKDNKSWAAKGDGHDDIVIALAIVNFACLTERGIGRGFVGVEPLGSDWE